MSTWLRISVRPPTGHVEATLTPDDVGPWLVKVLMELERTLGSTYRTEDIPIRAHVVNVGPPGWNT